MPNVPMRPVYQLRIKDRICSKFIIDKQIVSHWKYGKECPGNFSPIPAGSLLEIFELNKVGEVWVKASLPHTHNTMYLKISGEELALRFLLVQ